MPDTKTQLSISLAAFYAGKGANNDSPDSPANSLFWRMFLDIDPTEVENMLSLYRKVKSINNAIRDLQPVVLTRSPQVITQHST